MSGSEMSLDAQLVVDEQVVFRELDGETVLLNLESGNYFGLDEVGTRVWTLMREHGTLGGVLSAMTEEYDVSPDALKADLLMLAEQLTANSLVHVRPAAAPPTT